MVEILDFDVGRAWKLISCPGPPCCPNTWLIEVEPNTFVFVESWEWLREPADLQFPGAHVTIERLPLSGRVLAARATGPALPVPETPDEMRYLWTWEAQECAVLGLSDLEPEFLRAAGLSSPLGHEGPKSCTAARGRAPLQSGLQSSVPGYLWMGASWTRE